MNAFESIHRVIKSREPWFSAIPGSSSSEEDAIE